MNKNYLFQHLEPQFSELALDNPNKNIVGIVLKDRIIEKENLGDIEEDPDAIFIYRRLRTAITHKEMEIQIGLKKPLIFIRGSVEGPIYEEIGDHRLEDSLMGRAFEHGIYDCGSAVRSFFWQRFQILIKDMPRDYGWWEPKYNGLTKNLYGNFIDRNDWVEITESTVKMEDLTVGDVFTYTSPKGGPEYHAGV